LLCRYGDDAAVEHVRTDARLKLTPLLSAVRFGLSLILQNLMAVSASLFRSGVGCSARVADGCVALTLAWAACSSREAVLFRARKAELTGLLRV